MCKAEYSPCSTCLLRKVQLFISSCSAMHHALRIKLSAFSHPTHSSSYVRCVFAEIILKLCTTMQIENCSSVTDRISRLTMCAQRPFPKLTCNLCILCASGASQISSQPHVAHVALTQIHLLTE